MSKTLDLMDCQEQRKLFDLASAAFQGGDFARARSLFTEAAQGPTVEISHAAQLRVRMCERRLEAVSVELQTGEDHYNYAVTLMNRARLDEAEPLLQKAISLDQTADHFYYALALCCGLRGDSQSAANYLRRAIEIDPQNLVTARNDPDFSRLRNQAPLRDLLTATELSRQD